MPRRIRKFINAPMPTTPGGGNGGEGDGGSGGSGGSGGGNDSGSGGSGDGGGQGGGSNGGNGGDGSQGTDAKITMSQDELSRKLASEKAQGERAAERKVAETLGCTIEEAKKILDDKRAADTAAMSEADRKAAEATAAQQKADREADEARRERLNARIDSAIIRAGLDTEDEKNAAAVTRIRKLVDLEPDATPEQITQAVADLKKDVPALFAGKKDDGAGGGGGKGAPSSAPGGTAPRPTPPADAKQRAIERATKHNARRGVAVGAGSTTQT